MECQEKLTLLLYLVVLTERPVSPNSGIMYLHGLPDTNTHECVS